MASSTNPATWASFEEAVAMYRADGANDGIGFFLGDGWIGGDLDDCLNDCGSLEWGSDIIGTIDTYTEISPSVTGLKFIGRGRKPTNCSESVSRGHGPDGVGQFELYDRARFFCITGNLWPGKPSDVRDCQRAIDALCAKLWKPSDPSEERNEPYNADDFALALQALKHITPQRADNYDDWITVGLALHRVGNASSEALGAWETWSKQSSKFVAGECAERWAKISDQPDTPRVGLKRLLDWAKSDAGWVPEPRAESPDNEPESTVTEWPEPIGADAYHGLAGEIVRKIAPHTEAASEAVLIHILVAVGNIIGRNAHFDADGAKHYSNINAVLVGATSKGRKDTARRQAHRLLQSVAPGWAEKCVVEGLSSGEGLIWAVRDPIVQRQAVKEKGRVVGYEDVESDPGVDDKRLLVTESEFAQCLKVIQRETNTLSPVIRRAWDGGDLRTLTKNSPATSTGAHISIVGHITKDELRRLLDATESANGFANRFLWLCTRRSKCLPEGGAIHEVDFDDEVRRLNAALEFGEQATLIPRNPDSRAIWAQVYPELSNGKSGMLGAVTSRAEAQVMRLALIYAVLDCSPWIRPDHLRAGMAVWDYCERSCLYIFGASTGDKIADQLLAALRAAPAGLTRKQITVDVFKGHTKSELIAAALGRLSAAGSVRKVMEVTQTRPIERWFAVVEGANNANNANN